MKPPRAKRGSVMAGVLTLLMNNRSMENYEIRKRLGISARALSVTMRRLILKGLVQREARGLYSLKEKS